MKFYNIININIFITTEHFLNSGKINHWKKCYTLQKMPEIYNISGNF